MPNFTTTGKAADKTKLLQLISSQQLNVTAITAATTVNATATTIHHTATANINPTVVTRAGLSIPEALAN